MLKHLLLRTLAVELEGLKQVQVCYLPIIVEVVDVESNELEDVLVPEEVLALLDEAGEVDGVREVEDHHQLVHDGRVAVLLVQELLELVLRKSAVPKLNGLLLLGIQLADDFEVLSLDKVLQLLDVVQVDGLRDSLLLLKLSGGLPLEGRTEVHCLLVVLMLASSTHGHEGLGVECV